MSVRFNYGDKAEFNGHQGKITSIWFNKQGDRMVRIEFDDKKLVPPEMEVFEKTLKPISTNSYGYYGGYYDDLYDYSKKYGPIDEVCPKCGTKWTITKFNNNNWKDCKKCNKKYEDLV